MSKPIITPNSSSKISNPKIIRIFTLGTDSKSLYVPPIKYSEFLKDCKNRFIELVLEKNKSRRIEEAQEKYKKSIKKSNPNISVNDLSLYDLPFIESYIDAKIIFEDITIKKTSLKKTSEHHSLLTKDLILSIKIENDIAFYVNEFSNSLDKINPKRKHKITDDQNFSKLNFFGDFEFSLLLNSYPTNNLETKIQLINYGCIYLKSKEKYHIPGIKLETSTLYGSLEFPRKITNELENILKEYYKPTSVTYKQAIQQY